MNTVSLKGFIRHAMRAVFFWLTFLTLPLIASATTPQNVALASKALSSDTTPWQLRHRYFRDQGKQLLIVATRPNLQPHDAQIAAVDGLRFLFQPSREFTETSAWPLTKNPVSDSPPDTQRLTNEILAALIKGERVFVICDERHFAALAHAIEQGLLCLA